MDEKFTLKSLTKRLFCQNNLWNQFFAQKQVQSWFKKHLKLLISLNEQKFLIPSLSKVFRPFELTQLNKIRVCIIGDSPYNRRNIATGIPFSSGIKNFRPPSLKNIFNELRSSYPNILIDSNLIDCWSAEGVYLYNFVPFKSLEPTCNKRLIHIAKSFTKLVIIFLCTVQKNVIFILLGKNSLQCNEWIFGTSPDRVITLSHPSPLSAYRSFTGSKIFCRIDSLLDQPVNWNIPNLVSIDYA